MYSGLSAAYKLLGDNYKSRIIDRELNLKRKISFANRLLFENLSDQHIKFWVNRFKNSDDPLSILKRSYDWNWKKIIKSTKLVNRYAIRFS